ncbi:hypothetical protein K3495_g11583 [Podosphaera aphanis]|nr:hypothetical protein K3495_g11583 [Podosphaera aphanis]
MLSRRLYRLSVNLESRRPPARYANDIFYGIVIDTGASKNSSAGYSQYQALCKVVDTPINTSTAGTVKDQFGIGYTTSIDSLILTTPIGDIEFHIVKADTPFLLTLPDMDKLGVNHDNIHKSLVSPSTKVPIIRRFGHAFLIWGEFNLRDPDLQFNHSIIVDVMYIESVPVLHIVETATKFQAARWLQNNSTKHIWDAISSCLIGVYIGPPDFIVTDAGTKFTSKEFY